jgi:hypothetical protein
MEFGEVLSKAWKIIWKHKILWVFGILAGLGSGTSSNAGSRVNYQTQSSEFPQVQRFIDSIPIWVWLLVILAVILLAIIILLLGTLGRIGLVKGTMQSDDGAASLSFGKLFSESLHYFWRIFGFNLLWAIAAFILVIVVVVLIVLFGIATLGIGLICLVPLICLMIPVLWFIQILVEQTNIAIVVEDTGIFDGLSRGWNVVIKNIGAMILMALIIFVGGGIVNFVIALPLFLIAMPVVINLIASNGQVVGPGLVVTIVLFIVYLPILLVATGIVKAYISAAWTLTYRRLTGRRPSMPALFPVTPVEQLPTIEPASPVELAPPTE